MTTYYAIGGGNWADATLNSGNGLWNTASDGSGSWGGPPGATDIAEMNGNIVTFDVVTDQTITGGIACLITGEGQIGFGDTTSSGAPVTLNDGAAVESPVAFSMTGGYAVASGAWVRFSTDMSAGGSLVTTLGDGSVCVITASQSGSFQTTGDSGSSLGLLIISPGLSTGGSDGVSAVALSDPSTVAAGTTYAIASGYGGPGGMVGTATLAGTPDASSMLNTYTYEGVTGNVVMPTEPEVELNITFGPSSGLTGSFVGASGLAASPLRSLIIDAG